MIENDPNIFSLMIHYFFADSEQILNNIEKTLAYPLIAKPVDDGCSSAVKKIKTRIQLRAFLETIFRETEEIPADLAAILQLKTKRGIVLFFSFSLRYLDHWVKLIITILATCYFNL
jgi:hypothetical protein